MASFYTEIVNEHTNLPNLVIDNYYKDQIDIKSIVSKGNNLILEIHIIHITEDDNQQYGLITGSSIDFTITQQPDQMIDQIKYLFSFQNLGTGNYSFYGNLIQLIEYVFVYVDNKEIQKIDTYQLNMLNLLNIKETAQSLKVQNLGLGVTKLAPNAKGSFLKGSLIHFQNIVRYQIIYITIYKCQLKIPNQIIIKFLSVFMLVQAQLSSSTTALNTRLNSYLPITYVLLMKIGQNTQITEEIGSVINNNLLIKHFQNFFCFQDSISPIYNNTMFLNFSLNPQFSLDGQLFGAQQISKDDYGLNITFPNAYGQQFREFTIGVFFRREEKKVFLLPKGTLPRVFLGGLPFFIFLINFLTNFQLFFNIFLTIFQQNFLQIFNTKNIFFSTIRRGIAEVCVAHRLSQYLKQKQFYLNQKYVIQQA